MPKKRIEKLRVTFLPSRKSVRAVKGECILDVIRKNKLSVSAECGGNGICGKCRVRALPHPAVLSKSALEKIHKQKPKLACSLRVTESLLVELPDSHAVKKSKNKVIRTLRIATKKTISTKLGVAIDIGTTTLVIYLCDLAQKKIIAKALDTNPQTALGADLVARISLVQSEKQLHEIQQMTAETLNHNIREMLSGLNCDMKVREVTIVGNTTMLHFISKRSPEKLAVAPFQPESHNALNLTAKEIGLALPLETPVYLFPTVSGFVGGDAVGAVLAQKLHQAKDNALMIDIGTNGEIVLSLGGELHSTSCATGPAFEGSHISCGMRARPGAICSVRRNKKDGRFIFSTIDKKPPVGLCGSGIIDLTAELLRAGIISQAGNLLAGDPRVVLNAEGLPQKFVLVPAGKNSGKEISFSAEDIRKIQLAKAALSAGIKILLLNNNHPRLDRLVLTGAFGARFNYKNAFLIGMLPEEIRKVPVEVAENSAGMGAVLALYNSKSKRTAERIAPRFITHSLADDKNFFETFVAEMHFPELNPNA